MVYAVKPTKASYATVRLVSRVHTANLPISFEHQNSVIQNLILHIQRQDHQEGITLISILSQVK